MPNPLTRDTMPLATLLTLPPAEQARWRWALMTEVGQATHYTGLGPHGSQPWQTYRALLALKRASAEEVCDE